LERVLVILQLEDAIAHVVATLIAHQHSETFGKPKELATLPKVASHFLSALRQQTQKVSTISKAALQYLNPSEASLR
jgi:hypothetical protein